MADGLGDFADMAVRWHDATRHGSLLSGRLHETVRQRLYPRTWARLAPEMAKDPNARARFGADELGRIVREDRASEAHRQIVRDPDFWRPDSGLVRIEGCDVASEECGSRTSLSLASVDIAAMRHWARTGESDNSALLGLSRILGEALARASFRRTPIPRGDRRPLMIGHACVSWSDGDLRLWTDPFIRPKRLRYPARQQPLSPLDAAESSHAVLITHCHPDHFDPASLLLFPASTTIIVPHVAHETPLAFDMALRARQLGFRDVRALAWGEACAVGRFAISAWPFYGEQPLGAHAEQGERPDRNQGSTYHVAGPDGLTALFLADAGSDPAGSSLELARGLRGSVGRVDLVFGNHRRWLIYPPQFVTTSVAQNLCYVPDEELGVPQLMMLTPEQLTEIGEILSARHVVPYAMGNAPWFAEIGLGPRSDHTGPGSAFDAPLSEAPESDPDALAVPAARRTVLAPGDRIDREGRSRDAGFARIDPAAFPPVRDLPPPRALALGGLRDRQTVRDLLALTRVDPASYLVAAPGFVEIATTDPDGGAFLWELVMRLVDRPAWTNRSPQPLVCGLFAQDAGWLRRFEACHHRASRALREGGDGLAAIRPLVDELRSASSSDAIEGVARDLLGLDLALAPSLPQHGDPPPSGAIALPRAADGLVARHGASAVTSALLLVKLIHNVVLTMRALGDERHGDEADAFAHLLREGAELTA